MFSGAKEEESVGEGEGMRGCIVLYCIDVLQWFLVEIEKAVACGMLNGPTLARSKSALVVNGMILRFQLFFGEGTKNKHQVQELQVKQ